MAELLQKLQKEFSTLEIAREQFPMWTSWGLDDESVAVHSLGLTYLTTLGQHLGYVCCCEFPVANHKVRADAVWWDKSTKNVVALFEFERYKGGNELRNKVQNLLLAYHHAKVPPHLLALIFWTKNFYPLEETEVCSLWRIFEKGYEVEDRSKIPAASPDLLKIFECTHYSTTSGQYTLKSINERSRR